MNTLPLRQNFRDSLVGVPQSPRRQLRGGCSCPRSHTNACGARCPQTHSSSPSNRRVGYHGCTACREQLVGCRASRPPSYADGWLAATPVGHLGLGYDHIAKKGGITRYVEVKSSAGSCVPSLTENEYSEACRLRRDYVLAVVENFDPTAPASIRWVQDPAHLRPTKRAISDVLAASI